MKVGIAIKPQTSIETVIPYIDKVDRVLVMTVEPGFGGQKLKMECLEKVSALRNLYKDLDIQVDGGIDVTNIQQVADAGANIIVSGVIENLI
jgi:ribulose-phosphate 3-epimerase